MKRVCFLIFSLVVVAMMTACGEPFSVQQQGDEVVLTLRKAKCQTLWIPIENSAKESYMEVEGSSLYTVPMTVRLDRLTNGP